MSWGIHYDDNLVPRHLKAVLKWDLFYSSLDFYFYLIY